MTLPSSTERSRPQKRTNSNIARRARARARLKFGPTLDSLEPRQLLTDGAFLQGTAYGANQLPLPGAMIELFAVTGSNTTQIGQATTDINGNYYFDDTQNLNVGQSLIAPGTYQLVEVAPTGFQLSGAQVNTVAPPDTATVLPSNAIQVTIADPSQLSYTLNSSSTPYPEIIGTFHGQSFDSLIANQFYITVSEANPPQTSSNLITYCVDLSSAIFGSTPFPVTLEPAQTALPNGGQIAYLYNHYGLGDPLSLAPAALQLQLPFQNPTTLTLGLDADVTAGLQVAIWELEYGSNFQFTGLNSKTGNAQDFADIQSAAAWFTNDSSTHSEQAMVLAVQSNGQSLLAPQSLNFTNTVVVHTKSVPAINTVQQPASATVGSSIADQATVSGGNNPTGTVTFNLYNNPNGTGTPLFTDTETLVGGTATSAGYVAAATGTDYWVATYNGDSNNSAVTSVTTAEPVVLSPATPSINTMQQPATATVGTSIADKATVSGGFNPTGTVTFNLYANANAIGTPLFIDTETLVGGVATSKGYTAAATGTDYWVATYNGDSNNVSVSSGPADEPVVLSPATPGITTTPSMTTTTTTSGGVVAGQFATIGFWHNQNGQAVINSFNGGPTQTQLGNWLATNFPHLFGASNPYTGTSLAGLTNAQVASVYLNLWTPSGLQKNTYVQAFAVALGLYADTTSLGGQSLLNNGLAAQYGFVVTASGAGTFGVDGNGSAFGVSNGTSLPVLQILKIADSDFTASTGLFYGGDQNNSSAANNVLDGINSVGDIPGSSSSLSTTSVIKLNDSATLSGGANPTGTVTFYLFAPGVTPNATDSNSVYTDTVTVTGNGTYSTATGTNPSGYVPAATGTYQWVAVYSGDAKNNGVVSPFGSEPWTVGAASPTINTIDGGAVVLGSGAKLTDSAMLAAGVNPTGTVTFYLFAPGVTPNATDSNSVYTDTVTVTGNGTYSTGTGTNPGGYLPTATGTYQWVAVYSGDAKNSAVASPFGDEPETVTTSPSGGPVSSGDFATIGFWHNKNGQAVINSFNGSSTATALGNWLATNFPHLFGAPNPYTSATLASLGKTSLAGLTNAQVASVYLNLWTPSGVTKNTYVQAFAVALGIYADSSSLGYNSTAAGFGFVKAPGGGSSLTFGIGGNGPAFPVLGSTATVLQILQAVNANFDPATGNFYGGDQTKTSDANNVLNGINTTGDITLVTTGSTIVTGTSQLVGAGFYVHQGTLLVYVDDSLGNITPAEQARIDDAIANYNIQLGQYGATLVEVSADQADNADITIHMADTTDIGGVAEGVLGVTEMGGEITLVDGWNWYQGSDPSQIAPDQFDFETVAAHELGHAIGLGHSPDATSVMYPVLATGQVRRTLSASDLAVLDQGGSGAPEPLMAAMSAPAPKLSESAPAPQSNSSGIWVVPPTQSSATGLPSVGTPTTIVADHALTATPSIAAPVTATMTTSGLATVHVSSASGIVEAPGSGATSSLAGVLSQDQASATTAGPAAQPRMSSPFAFDRLGGFATTAQDNADNALRAMTGMSPVPDSVLDELASELALRLPSGGDGSITVPVLAPESVPGVAVPTVPDEQQDPTLSSASFAGRLAVVGLAAGIWGGTAVRNARKRRSWGLGLESKPLPPRKD